MKQWNYKFNVPDNKRVRMIVCADAKNEADDQFAIAHHLMTPKFIVKAVIGGHFNRTAGQYGDGHTATASTAEIRKVMTLMGVDDVPVLCGAEYPLEDEKTPQVSAGAEFIIEEAMRDDPHPLFVACQGAVTDLASALLMKPEIGERLTAIWIGGGDYPKGGNEFNLMQDIAAANVLMDSLAGVWQVPLQIYKQMAVTLSELQMYVYPCGEIGKYLFTQMSKFNGAAAGCQTWPHGEMWELGDSPTVGLLLEENGKSDLYDVIDAPRFNYENMTYEYPAKESSVAGARKKIRVYKEVNARLTLGDFFAKLMLNYRE